MANDESAKNYVIRIRHERPEAGKGVEFISTYYAKENQDENTIKEIFTKAFKSAHPNWTITNITI